MQSAIAFNAPTAVPSEQTFENPCAIEPDWGELTKEDNNAAKWLTYHLTCFFIYTIVSSFYVIYWTLEAVSQH
jgi:hypothetical protein